MATRWGLVPGMIPPVHDEAHRGRPRYKLTETEHAHVWGTAAEVEGLFGDTRRGTYEFFGWVPQAEAHGSLGDRVWLVPDDETLGPWLLEDTESLGRDAADGLVLVGQDDAEGPPEGHRGRVRVHNGHRWLGSCREFARVLAPEQPPPPLVLRGVAPSDRLRSALTKGTRQALNLEEAALEIEDDRGVPLTERLLWARVGAWWPSSYGTDLIDLELDGRLFIPISEHARPVWERWLAGPPDTIGCWSTLDTRRRNAWLDLVRERFGNGARSDRPAGMAYELDGWHITDQPALFLALGEAVNGPGGYFGGCLAALEDCLRGTYGHTAPATLLWRDAETARKHLSQTLTPDGHPYDLFGMALDILAQGGMRVVLA